MTQRGLKISEAGQVLGLSRASIYRLIKKGALPRPRKIGGIGVRLDARAVERLADQTWGAV